MLYVLIGSSTSGIGAVAAHPTNLVYNGSHDEFPYNVCLFYYDISSISAKYTSVVMSW